MKNLYGRLMLAVAISVAISLIFGMFWGTVMFIILLLMSLREVGLLLFFFACVTHASAGEIEPKFFKALHHIEASCRLGPIVGDNGKALGPFQIHRAYWLDSGVKGSYEQVADYNYAKKVVTAYLNRYAPDAVKSNNYEKMARIHNGGSQGHKRAATVAYWKKFKKVLDE